MLYNVRMPTRSIAWHGPYGILRPTFQARSISLGVATPVANN